LQLEALILHAGALAEGPIALHRRGVAHALGYAALRCRAPIQHAEFNVPRGEEGRVSRALDRI
jgi:hypothetical protein